jgi:crotonobetainyl-CoA:carnitine CoA-transferase CaiB-like acyl-CoA transferase
MGSAIKPLSGIKVLDLTTVVMGPYATQVLGHMGADVIKVEAPEGDPTRSIGPGRNPGMAPLFLNSNRSKRSLVLDLKIAEGREALIELCRTADVLICNIRPQAMVRLGLSYADICAANPQIIYVALVGYDQRGRYAAKPAYDDLVQGAVGIPTLFTRGGASEPQYVPLTIADHITGISAISTVLAAIIHKKNTGHGQEIVVPMFETLAEITLVSHLQGATFRPPNGPPEYARLLVKERRPYKTEDGYICMLLYNNKQWKAFLRIVGQEQLFETDSRFATMASRNRHIGDLYGFVAEKMLSRTSEEWLELFSEVDIPAMPLQTLEGLLEDPHLRDIGFFSEVEHPSEGPLLAMSVPSVWSNSQPEASRPAPRLGEHSLEVLRESGIPEERIKALVLSGATHDGSGVL